MNILYLMHIDWLWIKQRPQYIAECLSRDNYVYVLYEKNYNIDQSVNKEEQRMKIIPFYRIKGEYRSNIIHFFNSVLRKKNIKKICKNKKIDVIYVTSPSMCDSIPKNFKGQIIYDCMDDHLAMVNTKAKNKLFKWEKKLLNNVNKVIFSSDHLSKVIINRYNLNHLNYKVIRNGFSLMESVQTNNNLEVNNKKFNICYFGTVSDWFDWKIIDDLLKLNNDICFHIFGPIKTDNCYNVEDKIICYGPVKHTDLYSYTKEMDCFIMPFIVNDIILSVDPVKLYEYIYFNKNIVVPYYPEIKRFEKFVYYYNTLNQLDEIIKELKLTKKIKYTDLERNEFLQCNSWDYRCNEILKFIDED